MSGDYRLRKEQKEIERAKAERARFMRKAVKVALIAVMIAGSISGLAWLVFKNQSSGNSAIIAQNGIHWHPHLKIVIKGDQQVIPEGIGLGVKEQPVHTHDADGILHLEYGGLVTTDDIKLGKFFKIWGKQFNKDCIFDFCNGPEGSVKMSVNGQPNADFGNYQMGDGDQIEIVYE